MIKFGQMYKDIGYIFINYIVANIPCWAIRRLLYKCAGMKIGHNSRIMMKCIVLSPSHVRIGDRSIINEYCIIDGRGNLTIGNDCSISSHSKLLTGSHDYKSDNFSFRSASIVIGNNVWVCTGSIIIAPSVLNDKCVISAGSVFRGNALENQIYQGNPAKAKHARKLNKDYTQDWKPYFR